MAIITCPECGGRVSDNAPKCPHCGYDMGGRIVCTFCGGMIGTNDAICPKCSHPTPFRGLFITCPECNEFVRRGSDTCPSCGIEISKIDFCSECDAPLDKSKPSCGNCGAKAPWARTCPECGNHVLATVESCPVCGCPIPQFSESQHEEDKPATADFNEAEQPYSPFSASSWLFSKPWPISRYPQQGDLKESGSFLGWFLGPWHISYRGNGNKAAINTLNDIFLLFNIQWKVFLFPQLWVFFKLLWWIVGVIVVAALLTPTLDALKVNSETINEIMNVWYPIAGIYCGILVILGIFLYFCGWAESLRRYVPTFYDTFMRICKRFALSISKSIKGNNINI